MTKLSASKHRYWIVLILLLFSGSISGQVPDATALITDLPPRSVDTQLLATAEAQYQAATGADNPVSKIEGLLWLALFHEQHSGTVLARSFLHQALAIAQQTGDFQQQIAIYHRIGNALQQEGRDEEALFYHQRALISSKALHDWSSIMLTQYYMGQVLMDSQQYDSALHYFSEAQKLTIQTGDRAGWVVSTLAVGQAYQQQQRPTEALSSLQEALQVATSTEVADTAILLSIYQALGAIYRTLDQPLLGLQYVRQGLGIASGTHNTRWLGQRIALMRLVATLEADRNAYHDAYYYLSISNLLHDSLQQYSRQRQVEYLQIWQQLGQVTDTLGVLKAEVQWQQARTKRWGRAQEIIGAVNKAALLLLLAGCLGYWGNTTWSVRPSSAGKAVSLVNQEDQQQKLETIQAELGYKNQWLWNVEKQLKTTDDLFSISSTIAHQIQKTIINSISLDQEWSTMQLHFAALSPLFFQHLQTEFSQLSQNDLRLCAYIKLQFDNQEIAEIMHISPASVQKACYRLKKKMHLSSEVDLTHFITHG